VKNQVLLSIIDLISLSMVSFQKGDSKKSIASLKELGSPSTRYMKKSSSNDVRILVFFTPSKFRINYRSALEEEVSEVEKCKKDH